MENLQVKFYVIALLFTLITSPSLAKPVSEVQVIKEVNKHNAADGKYHFNYKLNDGTHFKETRKLEDAGGEAPSITVKGLYMFVEDGVEYTVRYTADATGFHPEGDHLPRTEINDVHLDKPKLQILNVVSKVL